MRRSRIGGMGIALAALAAVGCESVEVMVDEYRDMTPHEAYVAGLYDAGLATTALTRDWIAASTRAVREPVEISAPFVEEGYFTPEDPMAVGYRFRLERGQTVTIQLAVDAEQTGRVFLDLLRVAEAPGNPPRPVSADTTDLGFVYEPTRDGEYLVRIQPELLRGGAFRLSVDLDPALAFPVTNVGMRAAQSLWGAQREGGRRTHEGIDIFAPRGTPVIASVPGRVRRVDDTRIGGRVVWLSDEKMDRSLYYAHLDSQAVAGGEWVEIGDTLGFVGNTGNAITTPPHLHFGIYYRGQGAVDPAPFVRPIGRTAAALDVDPSAWGAWVRTSGPGIQLRAGPSLDAEVMADLGEATPVRVLGGSGDWYRVRTPDGRSGYLAGRLTEGVDEPVETVVASGERTILASPERLAPRVARIAAGASTAVLGRYAGFSMVRAPDGVFGWVVDVDTPADTDG